jgi:beta-galactosidase
MWPFINLYEPNITATMRLLLRRTLRRSILYSAITVVAGCLLYNISAAQSSHTFEIKNGQFLYDSKPIQIHSGEMHYARIPAPYWRHRLKMLKAMGCNTVATYVFWNYHHPSPGVWDFNTGNHNLVEFLRIAKEENLFVILRPGPYACAEWEFGGYPWWLLKDSNLVIRSYNQPFLDSCKVYINKLAEQVKNWQVSKGGPVIMVQVENEFGSYVSQRKDIPLEEHRRYNEAIKQLLTGSGLTGPFFTSDGSWLFDGGSLPGVLPAANGEDNVDNLKKAVNKYHNNEGPYMVAEYYPGWLSHWAEPFPNISVQQVTQQVEKYLKNNINFNFYMVHGGTNFGFTSGANYNNEHDLQPDLTSYDYDAPITEAGWASPKYLAVRELMKQYVKYPVPEIPEKIPVITLPAISLNKSFDVFDLKKTLQPVIADTPLSFEALNQGYGYVLYSKRFTQPIQGTLQITGLRDYAVVYDDGKKVAVLNRVNKQYTTTVDIPFNGTLDILVENMGRINYGSEIVHNTKGIISPVLINGHEITGGWNMYRLPFNQPPAVTSGHQQEGRAAVYSGTFQVTKTGDTFLDMHQWGKGIVFVNGYNLGRYWQVGPQQTLYLPGCWLKKGTNNIVVFEQLNDHIQPVIPTVAKPVLTELKN